MTKKILTAQMSSCGGHLPSMQKILDDLIKGNHDSYGRPSTSHARSNAREKPLRSFAPARILSTTHSPSCNNNKSSLHPQSMPPPNSKFDLTCNNTSKLRSVLNREWMQQRTSKLVRWFALWLFSAFSPDPSETTIPNSMLESSTWVALVMQ